MKKQPYHSPTRKSPRLSSSAPRNAKPESGTRPEDAWSLTVHVVEHQPLRICFPSTETVAPLRRSSRYTTNKYSSPPPERSRSKNRSQKALALVSSQLRRSPRFCSAPPLTLTSGENAGSKQSRRVAEAEESGRVRKRVKLICNGEPPRRSTRLSGGENGNSLLALPETGERSFRLRAKAESQKTKIKRTFDELSAKQKCSSIIKCDLVESAGKRKSNREVRESPKLDLLPFAESGKCLRSRIVKTQLQEERVERDVAVINGDDKCLKTPTKKLTFDRFTHVYEKKGKTINICFIGQPIPEEEAQKRWQWRYDLKSSKKGKGWKLNENEEDEIILNVHCHYAQAKLGNVVLNLGDCVHVKGEGKKKHVGRILEFFKTTDGEDYFRVQWFFMAEDTVLKDAAASHDKRRLFSSVLMNDNILDCIISKVNVVQVPATLNSNTKPAQSAAYYYDMEYCVDYSTFRTLVTESSVDDISESSVETQTLLLDTKPHEDNPITSTPLEVLPKYDSLKQELALLDLYSGCGGMSTGLCLGAKLASVNLITKWAVDYNSSACESLKLNHPETQVRNESGEDFLALLREWENLCKLYISDIGRTIKCELDDPPEVECNVPDSDTEESSEEYELSSLVDICFGDPNDEGKRGLHFKVHWKGYDSDEDTWEPVDGLSNCLDHVREFVRKGFNTKILPLPGDVDVICGGPPCQGVSGYNRYRNFDSPLDDERNRQIIVFMDIVQFLKPRYVLMENVVDIIRFDKGSVGRYALSRLVSLKYQARLGTMASGCYGLPQFRLRVFIWGAHPSEMLPQFPLPTHDVIVKYWPPVEFERNIVAYDEGQLQSLEDAIVLRDSISDLPAVENNETCEEMTYVKPPETEFQKMIRLSKHEMMGLRSTPQMKPPVLHDHRPLALSEHDYLRVCLVPHRKGANFRDLPGIIVGDDNVARREPSNEPVMLPTGRPMVPDCVLNFENGKSRRPYARVWWDETVSTVVTFPYVRCQAILHPEQDRLLTIRECARLQGFPDYYRFCGTTKARYCQIGNAVSIPVARALGYALGMAHRKVIGDEPLMRLPPKFSSQLPPDDEMDVVLER